MRWETMHETTIQCMCLTCNVCVRCLNDEVQHYVYFQKLYFTAEANITFSIRPTIMSYHVQTWLVVVGHFNQESKCTTVKLVY